MKIFWSKCHHAVTILLVALVSGCTSLQSLPASTLSDLAPPATSCPAGEICLTSHRHPLLTTDTRIYLHPLTLTPAVQARLAQDHDEERFSLEASDAIRGELSRHYLLVSEPANADVQIRVAITEVARASTALNVVSTAFLFLPLDLGGCQLEAVVTDLHGAPISVEFAQVSGSVFDFRAAFSPYGHALLGVQRWANRFSDSLVRTQWSSQL